MAWGTNYYRFTAGENGGHLIETYNLDSDIDWVLYTSSSLSAASEVDSGALYSDTTAESVVVPLSAGVTYYLVVDEWSGSAGYYDLRIVSP